MLVNVTRLFVSATRFISAAECAVIVFVCAVSLYMTICPYPKALVVPVTLAVVMPDKDVRVLAVNCAFPDVNTLMGVDKFTLLPYLSTI